jgi:two-component system alkaline phosphatase synthesis response regulator PhoP
LTFDYDPWFHVTRCHASENPRSGVPLYAPEALDAVWGYQTMPETRIVDVHVSWLRQKSEPDPHEPRFIVTVFGIGYRFEK